ncbi:hypothetical protein [Pseudofrankia inefficax]|uniref:Lipoprotein n=1 Tax=Pseudofrankia inefficax (strain DSM 45817 / CECT 9037 / DDB 130130 / EuI1c) TaxID=298654 RepID=E3J4E8_PSEI1|nr:hypothetical protein [Pseudofrankia inefficax]ADP83067.1 hypothetical protein FraEuI1c_5078 [Pseudofrankia inefficax]
MSRHRNRTLTATFVSLAAAATVAGLTACQAGTLEAQSASSSATTTAPVPTRPATATDDTGDPAPAAAQPALAVAPVAATSAAAAGAPAAPGTADARQNHCSVPLPDQVIGAPSITPGGVDGVWVWHDGTGWHLRVTHPSTSPEVFTGTVRSAQTITAHPYALEKGDTFHLSADRHVLTFTLTNHGRIDGFDLTDQCAIYTQFGFQHAGAELPASAVHLGAHAVAAATDPLIVRRRS